MPSHSRKPEDFDTDKKAYDTFIKQHEEFKKEFIDTINRFSTDLKTPKECGIDLAVRSRDSYDLYVRMMTLKKKAIDMITDVIKNTTGKRFDALSEYYVQFPCMWKLLLYAVIPFDAVLNTHVHRFNSTTPFVTFAANSRSFNQFMAACKPLFIQIKYAQIRGLGADLIIHDEFLFSKAETILTALLPVASERRTSYFALSTPQDYCNPLVQLVNTKDDTGDTIFRIVRIGKGCDECQKKKVMCPHADDVVSEGISTFKQQQFKHFYKGNAELYSQEYGGETSNSSRYCFSPDHLRLLLRRRHAPVIGPIDLIMVTIDPAGTGKNEWAFCACYYDTINNMQVIIQTDGLCVDSTEPSRIGDWLRRSIEHVRTRHPLFTNVPILIACENAPINTGNTIAEKVNHLVIAGAIHNVHVMYEFGKNKGPGVGKTERNTEDMTNYSSELIVNEQVCFSEVYSSCVPGMRPEDAKFKFVSQLANLKLNFTGIDKKTGVHKFKIHGKSGNKNDDQCIAYIMQYYWYMQAMTDDSPRYSFIRAQAFPRRIVPVRIVAVGISERVKRIRDEVIVNPHTKKRHNPVEYNHYSDEEDDTGNSAISELDF